ncbi:MAG: hypothetical protein U0736_10315 [Gemmataceae bacterium]
MVRELIGCSAAAAWTLCGHPAMERLCWQGAALTIAGETDTPSGVEIAEPTRRGRRRHIHGSRLVRPGHADRWRRHGPRRPDLRWQHQPERHRVAGVPGQLLSTLAGIVQATLTGGIRNDRFTVTGWTGTATLMAGVGIDTVLAAGDGSHPRLIAS